MGRPRTGSKAKGQGLAPHLYFMHFSSSTSSNQEGRYRWYSLFEYINNNNKESDRMGVYLSVPCTDVEAEEGSGNNLQYAVGEMQVIFAFYSDLPTSSLLPYQ